MRLPTIASTFLAALALAPDAALSGAAHPASPQKTGQIELQVNYCRGNTGLMAHLPGTNQQVILGQNGTGIFYFVVPGTYTLTIEIPGRQPHTIQNVVVQDNTITQVSESFCVDNDGDGYSELEDCNDNNVTINPAAAETCDGVDNNCNAQTDEGCQFCTDADNDGFYAQAGCGSAVDCDDHNATTSPGALEHSCDGKDNDCDGRIDETFDKESDPNHCGACFNVCSFPNAAAVCSNGTCGLASCMPGFSDCDGNPQNGCEAGVSNDPGNCGACGNVCPSGWSCNAGQCTAQCTGDVNCPYQDFCDTTLTCQRDLLDGGACNRNSQCVSANCEFGTCQAACPTGTHRCESGGTCIPDAIPCL
ncbi:hypothetical protein SVA_0880 [Sulfurifustis variabilis]|uniref:Uncharacterized protein n=1 Tax=Sulfurifustis variabilis TaxID=1675686 RepID=A0A1B4V1T6_9GAMM|nr:MopE-related protein [Sulfurifustis variabilis]BAU47459.1 hypothetical protein SVA_0880 [Sulfurifustis variabilis]